MKVVGFIVYTDVSIRSVTFKPLQWSPEQPRSIHTLQAHMACVYQAVFSPHEPDILATCSTDGTMKIFDLRVPSLIPQGSKFTTPQTAAALTVPASGTEVLTLDWNKYRPFVLATAGVDKSVKVWDCRMIKLGAATAPAQSVGGLCESQLMGHEYAVRKIQWSPHRPDVIASASYDMTCRMYVYDYYMLLLFCLKYSLLVKCYFILDGLQPLNLMALTCYTFTIHILNL